MAELILIEKYPILKQRSMKSREKIADSYMDVSNKLWATIFMSVITIPLAFIFKVIFSTSSLSILNSPIIDSLLNYTVALMIFYAIGTLLAFWFRKMALDIYDSFKIDNNM